MTKLTTILTALLLGLGLASEVCAQWSIDSTNGARAAARPFGRLNAPGRRPGFSTASQDNGPGAFSVPQVMPVVRSRRSPVKAVFAADQAEVAGDKVIRRLDSRRASVAKQMRSARVRGDTAAASRLLREMESIRQQRLERLRRLAPPRVIEVAPADPLIEAGAPEAAPADEKPILPIPTRPGGGDARKN